MQEACSVNASLVLKKIKKALQISTDIELSEFLNIKPNTISTWKKRNSLDYAAIISICDLYEIDLNEIFLEKSDMGRDHVSFSSTTPLVTREVQFQYCMGSTGVIESLPKYNFPFIESANTRAFQVLSNNMDPIIEENSFVICESAQLNELPNNSLVVIVSSAKGLFINRFSRSQQAGNFILSSENRFFSDVQITAAEISEIWLIKGVLSFQLEAENKIKTHKKPQRQASEQ